MVCQECAFCYPSLRGICGGKSISFVTCMLGFPANSPRHLGEPWQRLPLREIHSGKHILLHKSRRMMGTVKHRRIRTSRPEGTHCNILFLSGLARSSHAKVSLFYCKLILPRVSNFAFSRGFRQGICCWHFKSVIITVHVQTRIWAFKCTEQNPCPGQLCFPFLLLILLCGHAHRLPLSAAPRAYVLWRFCPTCNTITKWSCNFIC